MSADVSGYADPRFPRVAAAFALGLRADDAGIVRELGAALCIVHRGETVIDLWGGWADPARSRLWTRDSQGPIMSATKAWTALVIHGLAQDGLLRLDRPIAEYWPEFGRSGRGKDAVTIDHVLDHSAGLPIVRNGTRNLRFDQIAWEAALIDAPLLHPPGERHIYHPLTWGYLLDAVARRAAGTTVAASFQRRFARPLGLAARIGWGDGDVVDLAPPPAPSADASPNVAPAPLVVESLLQAMDPIDFGAADYQAGEVAGANGVASARDLALWYAALLDGTAGITAATLSGATRQRWAGVEEISGKPWRMAPGLLLSSSYSPFLGKGSFGHPGRGGITAFADPEREIAFGYVPNLPDALPGDGRVGHLTAALAADLEAS